MNILILIIPASLAGLVIFGATRTRRRSDVDLGAALKRAYDLFPYTNTELMDEDTFWEEGVGGVGGMRGMLARRRAMMLTGRDLAAGGEGGSYREINGLWKDILLCGLALWWVGWASILLEAPMQVMLRRFHMGRMPRILAWSAAKLYCDMSTSLAVFTRELPAYRQEEVDIK